jgi:hypothetical protein
VPDLLTRIGLSLQLVAFFCVTPKVIGEDLVQRYEAWISALPDNIKAGWWGEVKGVVVPVIVVAWLVSAVLGQIEVVFAICVFAVGGALFVLVVYTVLWGAAYILSVIMGNDVVFFRFGAVLFSVGVALQLWATFVTGPPGVGVPRSLLHGLKLW